MNKKSIAVIGQGFVGGTLTTVFAERGFDVHAFDKTGKLAPGAYALHHPWWNAWAKGENRTVKNLVELCECPPIVQGEGVGEFTNVYFVCVPTPMKQNGEADLSIVEGVLDELSEISGDRTAVVKSTVPPGSTEKWNKKYESTGLRVVFNPEFLTERVALQDMRNQKHIIIGGPSYHVDKVRDIYRIAFHDSEIIKTSSTTAEMVKYMKNCFFAAKVSIANEFSQICQALVRDGFDVDYDRSIEISSHDERFGKTHWAVPGPDGDVGFGGSCFPKDVNALMFLSKTYDIDPKMLSATWEKNLEVRHDKNWERLVGRAVVDDKQELDANSNNEFIDKLIGVYSHNIEAEHDDLIKKIREQLLRDIVPPEDATTPTNND